ncbi:hypothetical protein [Pseudarthrobacter phenanthrenivorans]|uniref:hypothetical protein n=1 Tax=Pseudarthrobacter phenanthrenivorans TaxID=361575 RepID=UPI00069018C3|nr:hypothetical protein [Pseudarthrobacter phenanthrenivorans]
MSENSAIVRSFQAAEREFWDRNAGIKANQSSISQAAVGDRTARALMEDQALGTEAVAELLGRQESSVRQDMTDLKLYAYEQGGRAQLPAWQFTQGGAPIPGLDRVLAVLPADLHPQSVAGFFLTPQPDLVLKGIPRSAKEWLESGGPVEPVLQLASGLRAGI